ncbi:MAG: DUF2695 domain-containing protein [Bacteroidota bacterium]
MSKNKAQRDKIKAWKAQQANKFLATLPFSESVFRSLFLYLNKTLEAKPCQHNFDHTTAFLATQGIEFQKHVDFFINNGGGCDCEVLHNVEGAFPEPLAAPPAKRPKPTQKTKLDSLQLPGFELTSVPNPWKLFQSGKTYQFQLGKKQEVMATLLMGNTAKADSPPEYWEKEWTKRTKLTLREPLEITQESWETWQLITAKTPKWTPAMVWGLPETGAWALLLVTEMGRLGGDLNEFKNLLRNINIKPVPSS